MKTKTAFITGANRGLGKGFVEFLKNKGYCVFAGMRNPASVDEKLASCKTVKIIQIDVSDDNSINNAYKEVSKRTHCIDLLINNAGVNKDTATGNHKELVCNLKELDRASLLKMFNINTVSPIIIIKTFLPLLKGRPSFVINISSNRASYHDEAPNLSGNYGYRASKIALNMLTFCSLFDLPRNVKTFAVHPGLMKTDMNPDGTDNPEQQAEKIIKITNSWNNDLNGKFLRYDGTIYPT